MVWHADDGGGWLPCILVMVEAAIAANWITQLIFKHLGTLNIIKAPDGSKTWISNKWEFAIMWFWDRIGLILIGVALAEPRKESVVLAHIGTVKSLNSLIGQNSLLLLMSLMST